MLLPMKYLVVIALLLSACHRAPQQVRYVPRDPMYDLCMTTDFSHHTDKELSDCGVWLGARAAVRGAYMASPYQSPRATQDGTLTILRPNGHMSMYSCDSGTCIQVK